LILIIVQTTAFRFLGISSLRAPLVVSLVVYAAFRMERTRGLCLSFLIGYAVDVYSGGIQGVNSLVAVVLCLAGRWMGRGIFVAEKLVLGVVALAFGLMQGVLWLCVGALVEGVAWLSGFEYVRILSQSMVLAVVTPFLVGIAAPIDRWANIGWRRIQGIRN